MDNKKFFTVLLLILIIIQIKFVYIPGKNRLISLNQVISDKKSDFETLQKLCLEYAKKTTRERENTVKTAKKGFSLFSYTGTLLTEQTLEKNVAGIQPMPSSEKGGFEIERLRLSLEDITLKQLYDFLYRIEKPGSYIYIPDFRMLKDKEKPFFVDTEMELIAVRLTQ